MKNENLTQPNVLYITTHDQGIAASCYSEFGPGASSKMDTPNIDGLAQKGAMLTNHFGTAPQCSPARGSLITSQHPHENGLCGLTHRGFGIENKENTIFNHFKNHGYETVLIGFQHETHHNPKDLGYAQTKNTGRFSGCFALMDDINETMAEMKRDNEKGQPYWLSIGVKEVHLSWEKFIKKDQHFAPDEVDVPGYMPDTEKTREHLGAFYGVLKKYDTFLGKVFALLDQYNLRDDTIIVVTTDHGIAHPRAKGTLYDPGNHDLMVMSYPSLIPEGKKIHSLLSSIDFAPTMCDLCGLDPLDSFKGKSYKKLLLSDTLEETEEINAYVFTELTYHDIYNPMRAVRSSTHKYIKNYEADNIELPESIPNDIRRAPSWKEWKKKGTNTGREKEEFYNLEEDPLEEHNIIHQVKEGTEDAKVLKNLKQALRDYMKKTDDAILEGPYPAPEDANIDNAADYEHIPARHIFDKILSFLKSVFL